MGLNNIEQLLEKYNNGETSLKEEQALRTYFKTERHVPEHLEVYKPLFLFFEQAKNEQSKKPLQLIESKPKSWYKWLSIAAVAILALGLCINKQASTDLGTFNEDEKELAYKEVSNALQMMSKQFNKGTDNVQYLARFNDAEQQMSYLGEVRNPIGTIVKF